MKTIRDYVQFQCTSMNYDVDRKRRSLMKAIKADCGLDDEDSEVLSTFIAVYLCTESVTFDYDGHEKAPLVTFKKRWDALGKNPSPKRIWEVRSTIHIDIYNEWCGAFNEAQDLFDVPVEQKSLDQLPPDLREEAEKPNSPLPEPIEYGKSA